MIEAYSSKKSIEDEQIEEETKMESEEEAVKLYCDYREEMEKLKGQNIDLGLFESLKNCCFKVNPYIHRFDDELLRYSELAADRENKDELVLLKTHRFNYVVINKNALELLSYFNGSNTILEIFNKFKENRLPMSIVNGSMAKHSWKVSAEREEHIINSENDFLYILRFMYLANLIELYAARSYPKKLEMKPLKLFQGEDYSYNTKQPIEKERCEKEYVGKSILLLGETPGAATIGLLYIASYLRRNGIRAYCQYNNLDIDNTSLKDDIKKLIDEWKPQVVGVSIKWFVHMARGLEICKIVKEISKDIEVIVGGNTSSLYREEFISYNFVDYVVCGDGEVPILKICKGEENIPNCFYKKDGNIIRNSITYVQDEDNSDDIYLSDLDELLVSKENLFHVPNYYVYTGKGCFMNCCYCGGCFAAQKQQFNRRKPFLRKVSQVRKDLIALKKYASTYMFIDSFEIDVMDYYKELWNGLDLSNHFCHFYLYKIPSKEFVDILVHTFRYVYINIDLCTLSERHREQLHALNLSKPLPKDREVLDFLAYCERYQNTEVSISLISGLPYYTKEDMEQSKTLLNSLMGYSSFKSAEWGRLHAQPGALIVENCSKFYMYSKAVKYEDFLYYSKLNMAQKIYPDVYSFKFPYISFEDEQLNTDTNEHYTELYGLIKNNAQYKTEKTVVYDAISYRELNEQVEHLAGVLRKNGVGSGITVCVIDKPSIARIVSMLAIQKEGGSCVFISPESGEQEIKSIIEENAAIITIAGTEIIAN